MTNTGTITSTSHSQSIIDTNIISEEANGLSHILIDDTNGNQSRIYDKPEIEQLIIERNKKHFSQAESTPLTTCTMKELLGPYATSTASQEILAGTFHIDSLYTTQAMKDILTKCTRIAPTNAIDHLITIDDVRSGMKTWRESTTTSPLQLHLGHMKALFKFERNDDTTLQEPQTPLSDRIFKYMSDLMNTAVAHRFVPDRWNTIHNIMLEKTPGYPYLPKLRTIQISEKDENLLFGILFGRRMPQQGEHLNAFGHEQGGSRTDRQTAEVSLFKHFMYSISRTTITNLASFDNDAKSCFDRIVMPLVSLAAQRLGMHHKACELLIQTLLLHKHYIVTQYGTSDDYFTSTEAFPVHGPGQGGKGSAAIWMTLSTLLMDCMENQSDGATFVDPYNDIQVQQRMTGFVDDTTHWINIDIRSHDHPSTIIDKMQTAAQYWEQLLHASGGKLELSKCFYYYMNWSFDEEGIPYLAPISLEHSTTEIIDSELSQPIRINSIPSTQSHRTLGIMENPSGDYNDEYQRLLRKAQDYARKIATASITNHEASILYFTMYLPAITYPLTVGTHSLQQLTTIQKPVTHAILPKMGYNRHFPLEVAYGPKNIGGLGLRHLFAEQGTNKTVFILKQLRINRPLGRLIQIKLAWDQRVAGISHSILAPPFYRLPHLQKELWTITLREYLQASELNIYIPNLRLTPMKRTHNINLMDTIVSDSTHSFSDNDIQMINRCRIYLKVETLADISNMAGTAIQEQAFLCLPEGQLQTTDLWPNQQRPGPKHIRQWKRFIKTFTKPDSLYLKKTLGQWISPLPQQQWSAYINKTRTDVILRDDNVWKQFRIGTATRNGFTLHQETTIDNNWPNNKSTQYQPVDVFINASQKTYIKPYDHIYQNSSIEDRPKTYDEYIDSLPQWESELLTYSAISHDPVQVEKVLTDPNATIMIVSDGGNIEQFGSFGWVIADNNHILFECNGIARGHPMTSYRAEAYGKLSWLVFLKHVQLFFHIKIKCLVMSYLDNKAIVQQTSCTTDHSYANSAIQADFDLLIAIQREQELLIHSGVRLQDSIHVKGHQDRHTPYQELSRPAQLNIIADKHATDALEYLIAHPQDTPSFPNPHCFAYLREGNTIISSKEHDKLRWRWSELRLQQYYARKFKLRIKQLHHINWAGVRMARDQYSDAIRRFHIKLSTNWLPISAYANRHNNTITTCHHCHNLETTDHLFQCPENLDGRQLYISALETDLKEMHTSPAIIQAIITGLHRWMGLPTPFNVPECMKTCFDLQSSFGWNLFVRGYLIQQWSQHQQQYCSELPSTNSNTKNELSGDTWNKNLCISLTRHAHALWTTRCNQIHNSPNDNEETIAQITRIYDAAQSIPISDRPTFWSTSLNDHINRGSHHIRSWIRRNSRAIKKMFNIIAKRHTGQPTLLRFWGRSPRMKPNTKIIVDNLTTPSAATALE